VGATVSPLRFGLTPVILDDRVTFLRQWAAWLEARLGRPVVFVQRGRYREIMDLLLRGGLDLRLSLRAAPGGPVADRGAALPGAAALSLLMSSWPPTPRSNHCKT
jgi:hypothetical protein